MNDKLKFFWVVFGIAILCSGNRVEGDTGSVTVDYSAIQTEKPPLGENLVYFFTKILQDSNGDLTSEAQALNNEVGFQITRFPLGNVHFYDWKRAIGPQAQRKNQLQPWFDDQGFDSKWGPDEGARFAEQVDGTLCIVINSNKDADDAADFVEYMNAPVGSNPNGGIDWAQVRAENGHPEPYHILYWEISNESGGRETHTWQAYPLSGDDRATNGMPGSNPSVENWWINGGSKIFTNQRAVRYSGWIKNDASGVLTSDGNTTEGMAGEKMYAKFPPMASLSQMKVGGTVWQEVADISTAGPSDQVFQVLDAETGCILFGDGVNGEVIPGGQQVYLDYVSGPHHGWVDYWRKMKAVDPRIELTGSNHLVMKNYLNFPADVGMDGFQVHGGISYNNNAGPAGGSFFIDYIGRSYFAYTKHMEAARTSLVNNSVPAGVKITQSENSLLQQEAKNPEDPLNIVHWRTLKAGLGHCLMVERAIKRFGEDSPHQVWPFMKTSLTNQGKSIEVRNGVLVATGPGRAQQLLIQNFGDYILTESSRNIPVHTIPWQDYQTNQYSDDIAKVIPLFSKSSGGRFYALGINTTSDEAMTLTVDVANGFDLSVVGAESWTLLSDSLDAINDHTNPNRIRVEHSASPANFNVVDSDTFTFSIQPATARVIQFNLNDTIAPATPANLTVTSMGNQQVALDWDDNTDADLSSYNVYRSGTPGGPVTLLARRIPDSQFIDTTAETGVVYYYTVSAIDANVNESVISEEVATLSAPVINYEPTRESLSQYQVPEWYQDAKIGFFYHWGPGSVPGIYFDEAATIFCRQQESDPNDYAEPWKGITAIRNPVGQWGANMYPRNGATNDSEQNTNFIMHREWFGAPPVNPVARVENWGYKQLIPLLTGANFDPDNMVRLLDEAGVKYVVPMAVHHDGFAMWDSDVIDVYNAKNMGPMQDTTKMVIDAARARGMKVGVSTHAARHSWYYSKRDGYDVVDPRYEQLYGEGQGPGGIPRPEAIQKWEDTLGELVDLFRPDYIFVDGGTADTYSQKGSYVVVDAFRRIVANYYNKSQEYGVDPVVSFKRSSLWKEEAIPDNESAVLHGIADYKWQTHSNISGWFYRPGNTVNSSATLFRRTIDAVSKNGNMLLNLAIKPDGSIEQKELDFLDDLKDWTTVLGEGIYASRPWLIYGEGSVPGAIDDDHSGQVYVDPFAVPEATATLNDSGIRYTRNKADWKTVYATRLAWTGSSFTLTAFGDNGVAADIEVTDVSLLGSNEQITWSRTSSGITITPSSTNVFPDSSWPVMYKLIAPNATEPPAEPDPGLVGFDVEADPLVSSYKVADVSGEGNQSYIAFGNSGSSKVDGGWESFSNSGDQSGTFGATGFGATSSTDSYQTKSDGAFFDLWIQNNRTEDVQLATFHIDIQAKVAALSHYTVSVLEGGGITSGDLVTDAAATVAGVVPDGTSPFIDQVDISLTDLADHVLEPGESATIRFQVSGTTGSGNPFNIDHIGLSYQDSAPGYFFDTNGATVGFGEADGSYSSNGAYWSTSSDGTVSPDGWGNGRNLNFGFVGSSGISGNTFSVDFTGTPGDSDFGSVHINQPATVVLTGDTATNVSTSGVGTWTVTSGATLDLSLNWDGDGAVAGGLNHNGAEVTLSGEGTIHFNSAVLMNGQDGFLNQNDPGLTVNLNSAATWDAAVLQGNYILNAGTLNFATVASAAAFAKMDAGKTVNLNGGTLDNTSGAPLTLDLGSGSYVVGGDFGFTGSDDLNLGVRSVNLNGGTRTITVTTRDLEIGGVITDGGLVKNGAGTLTLSGNNTYTGITTISAGTLRLGSSLLPGGLKVMPLGDSITYGVGGAGGQTGYRNYLYEYLENVMPSYQYVGVKDTFPSGTNLLPASPIDQRYHLGLPSYAFGDINNNFDGVDNAVFNAIGGDRRDPEGGFWLDGGNGTGRGPIDPDIVLMMLGTNDSDKMTGVRSRLNALLNKLVTKRPDAHVIVANIVPSTQEVRGATALIINEHIDAEIALFRQNGKHVSGIDLHTGYPEGEFIDGVHPNSTGYQWMAKQWNNAINAVAKEFPDNNPMSANFSLANSSHVVIAAGGTLDMDGNQTATRDLTVAGTLDLGGGELTVDGDLLFESTATLALGAGATGTQLFVSGNLTLDGSLDLSDAGGLANGIYPLFDYSGSLTDNGFVIGNSPDDGRDYEIDTSVPGEIRLQVVSTPAIVPAALFDDHAVFQRDIPLVVWGTAVAETSVTVSYRGQQVTSPVTNGLWSVTLDPMSANAAPADMTIAGSNIIRTITDTLVGEVWLASGQSNMEFTMNYLSQSWPYMADDISSANFPNIRQVKIRTEATEVADEAGVATTRWLPCTSANAGGFSATSFYFARELQQSLGVPVGIVLCAWSGSAIETWLPMEAFWGDPLLHPLIRQYEQNPDPVSATRPSGHYDVMLKPRAPYGIKGVIWYQGETDGNSQDFSKRGPYLYRNQFSAMIESWRTLWADPEMPFLFVQLPSWKGKELNGNPDYQNWAELRDSQTAVANELDHVGMAVTIDTGDFDDVHPGGKEIVGERLNLCAQEIAYGNTTDFVSGPLMSSYQVSGNNVVISFDYAESGLVLSNTESSSGFLVCGPDKVFTPAEASVGGNQVTVWSDSVPNPIGVRYAWSNWVALPTLFDANGLPASPFRTDSFQLVSQYSAPGSPSDPGLIGFDSEIDPLVHPGKLADIVGEGIQSYIAFGNSGSSKVDGGWESFSNSGDQSGTFGATGSGATNSADSYQTKSDGAFFDLSIQNNRTEDVQVDIFHIDIQAKVPALRHYTVSVLEGGGITSGDLVTEAAATVAGVVPDGTSPFIDQVDISLTDLADNVLEPGESVTIRFQVSGTTGSGNPFNIDHIGLSLSPVRPDAVTATDGFYDDRVRISWSGLADALEYVIYRNDSAGPDGAVEVGRVTAGTLHFDDAGATPGIPYFYAVTAALPDNKETAFSEWMEGERAAETTYRPDGLIGERSASKRGDAIYNTSAAGQTQRIRSKRRQVLRFFVALQNDGVNADDLTVRGTRGNQRFRAIYFERSQGGGRRNVTAAVVSGTHEVPLAGLAQVAIDLKTKRKGRKTRGMKGKTFLVRGSSGHAPGRSDTVRGKAKSG